MTPTVNRDNRRKYEREYYDKNRDKINAKSKRWHDDNRETVQQKDRERYWSNRAAISERKRILRWRDITVYNRKVREYRKRNRTHHLAASSLYLRKRRKTDINFRIQNQLRRRFAHAIRNGIKSTSAIKLLGCSVTDFKLYIESKFEPGMSWENYGKGNDKWNLDHIMPCAIFDLSRPEHQRRCFHFSNYQPLWQPENGSKGAKVFSNQFNLL